MRGERFLFTTLCFVVCLSVCAIYLHLVLYSTVSWLIGWCCVCGIHVMVLVVVVVQVMNMSSQFLTASTGNEMDPTFSHRG